MIFTYKYSSHFRDFPDSTNQPGMPRQLKTHIAFSMFPILGTNLWHQPWILEYPLVLQANGELKNCWKN